MLDHKSARKRHPSWKWIKNKFSRHFFQNAQIPAKLRGRLDPHGAGDSIDCFGRYRSDPSPAETETPSPNFFFAEIFGPGEKNSEQLFFEQLCFWGSYSGPVLFGRGWVRPLVANMATAAAAIERQWYHGFFFFQNKTKLVFVEKKQHPSFGMFCVTWELGFLCNFFNDPHPCGSFIYWAHVASLTCKANVQSMNLTH